MDYRICFVLSAFWMLTRALTLQPCHNGFEVTLGSVNTITCSEVKDNAVVSWRYGSGKDSYGHLAGVCQGFSSSEDNSCSSALLFPLIAPHRVSNTSSTLKINAPGKMEPGFVSCATLENGEMVKCDFDVVYPAEGVNCEAQFKVNVTNWLVRGACNATRMMSSRQKYDCQWYSLKQESSLRNQLMKVPMVTKPLADDSRKVSGSCVASMTFPVEAGVYTFGAIITPGQVDTPAVFRGSPTVQPPAAPRITCSPKGYLLEGQALTCSCSSTFLGLPKGILKLFQVKTKNKGLKSDVPHTSRDDGATLQMAPYNVTSKDHNSTSFRCDVMWANLVVDDIYTVHVGCAPRLPDNTDHVTFVKFSVQGVQHTFDVIGYPPPHPHNITIFDLKTVRFIADKTGSDLNVTCSHTDIRPYLSSCTMRISKIRLPLRALAIYKVTLANELGHVEHSVNIVNGPAPRITCSPKGYLREIEGQLRFSTSVGLLRGVL